MYDEKAVEVAQEYLDSTGPLIECSEIRGTVNRVFVVEFDSIKVVVKFSTFDERSAGLEPYVINLISEETDIPVPEVYGIGECMSTDYYVCEYIDGETYDHASELDVDTVVPLAKQVGKILGKLHQIKFDDPGHLKYWDNQVVPEWQGSSWNAFYSDILERFHQQARHNYPKLVDKIDLDKVSIPECSDLCFSPLDYHIGNFLFDEAKTVKGVIDFERTFSGHDSWTYTNTIFVLTYDFSEQDRQQITDSFEAGYASIREPPEQYTCYRVGAVLRAMRAAHLWWGEPSEYEDLVREELESCDVLK